MKGRLDGKVVIMTGASSGIGEATAPGGRTGRATGAGRAAPTGWRPSRKIYPGRCPFRPMCATPSRYAEWSRRCWSITVAWTC